MTSNDPLYELCEHELRWMEQEDFGEPPFPPDMVVNFVRRIRALDDSALLYLFGSKVMDLVKQSLARRKK